VHGHTVRHTRRPRQRRVLRLDTRCLVGLSWIARPCPEDQPPLSNYCDSRFLARAVALPRLGGKSGNIAARFYGAIRTREARAMPDIMWLSCGSQAGFRLEGCSARKRALVKNLDP